jgi:asparagine synthase (glutamine-hydrolysing)
VATVRGSRELLEDIIASQLVSDVPICALLSGGLDSSAITALAMRHGQIRSFSVDFAGYAENFTPDEIRGDADGPLPTCLSATSALITARSCSTPRS